MRGWGESRETEGHEGGPDIGHPEGACFFFSSRRRHTIFDCDWSSDVALPISYHGRLARALNSKPQARGALIIPPRKIRRGRRAGLAQRPCRVRCANHRRVSNLVNRPEHAPFMRPAEFRLIWRIRTFGRKAD